MRWVGQSVVGLGLGSSLLAAAACTNASRDGGAATADETGATYGGHTDGDGDGAAGDDAGEGARFDVALGGEDDSGPGGDGQTDDSCKKVDFLFVIDNSGSMFDEQQRLISAFPGFIESIRQTVDGKDHHIMVVDSDGDPTYVCEEFLGGGHCNGGIQQPNCAGYTCGDADSLQPCDVTLGAGVRRPVGGNASNVDCGFPDGRRFLTDVSPDLVDSFGCAAQVGTSGNSFEEPMGAMETALSDAFNEVGGCNEGFLRDDAILVVTLISDDPPSSDEGDDATDGDPQAWHDLVVSAKGGNPDAVVVLGLVPWQDTSCVFGNATTPKFIEFVEAFGDQGVLGSVCDVDYASIFDEAVGIIDSTCEEFIPPG